MSAPQVEIQYRRPPDRLDVFVQDLIVDHPDYKITLHDPASLPTPISIGERVVYEPGAPIVWFLFPNLWYDIGLFHQRDGTFTGYYVNLITPPQLQGLTWQLYDLFLDIWIDSHGNTLVLDRDEFDEAVDRLWLDRATARKAEEVLESLLGEVDEDRWPPAVVALYDLGRVRSLRARLNP